nr:MAG TPA: hypothetical protein [Bacteriophage sp.]
MCPVTKPISKLWRISTSFCYNSRLSITFIMF